MYDLIQDFVGYVYDNATGYEFLAQALLLMFAGWFGLFFLHLIFAFLGNLSKRI